MFVVTNREMREIDRYTIAEIGIPSVVLMENAGKAVADWIGKQYGNKVQAGVVCGKGKNGGDGLVIARHLTNRGLAVAVFIVGNHAELCQDTLEQYKIAKNIGLDMQFIRSEEDFCRGHIFAAFDILIDAILGTGTQGGLGAAYQETVQAINNAKSNSSVKVISVDNPTGVYGDCGEVAIDTINADVTLTLGYIKQSLLTYPASDYTGKVIVLDIGIPKFLEQQYSFKKQVITENLIGPWIPKRVANSNKGTYGKVRCITGSGTYPGAGLLASTACLHVGAGLVFWDVPEQVPSTWHSQTPELIVVRHASEDGHFAMESLASLIESAKAADAVVLGCGIGQFRSGGDWLLKLVTKLQCPIVIDADAFTMLAGRFGKIKGRNIVATPHPGEFASVLGISISELEKKRIEICLSFAKENELTLILKGSHTTIATPDGKLYINTTSNHVLAKAGTGDVLAGFIGGLLAQGLSTEQAACVAAYCHGRVAEQLAEKSYVSTMASDVSRNVGAILQKIANRA